MIKLLLERTQYLHKLHELSNKPLIKILVGLRRVGKSTILKQFMKQVGEDTCLYIQLEAIDLISIRTQEQFAEYIRTHLTDQQHILIDEIQLVHNRQHVANALLASYPNKNIIITGSNSDLLSSELGTILRGRVFQIFVFPFSYHEYCSYYDVIPSSQSFGDYLRVGGIPSLYIHSEEDQSYRAQELINTVFLRDIVGRFAIRDSELLRSLMLFLINTSSNQVNLVSIQHYLQSIGQKVSINTVSHYVSCLISSLLFFEVENYDLQGKKIFDRTRKFYAGDHGLRNYLFSNFDTGQGKQLEAYIYLSLLRHHYKVYIGKLGNQEIDFVAEKNGKKLYIQVAYLIANDDIHAREFGNLQKIQDNRPKYVISLDPYTLGIFEGIQHIQAWNWEQEIAVM